MQRNKFFTQKRKADFWTKTAVAFDCFKEITCNFLFLAPFVDDIGNWEADLMPNISRTGAGIGLSLSTLLTIGLAYSHYCLYLLNQEASEVPEETTKNYKTISEEKLITEKPDESENIIIDINDPDALQHPIAPVAFWKRSAIWTDKSCHALEGVGPFTFVIESLTHNHLNRWVQLGLDISLFGVSLFLSWGEARPCEKSVIDLNNESYRR